MEVLAYLILALVVFPVYADPVPYQPYPNLLVYAIGVVVAETTAWLIGAEFLWRLTRRQLRNKGEETSRYSVYKIMLLAMLISFSIGFLFWITLGWI